MTASVKGIPLLVFAETPFQANEALRLYPDATIVSITPIVDYWSEQSQHPVISIEELYDERTNRELGAEVIDRVEQLVVLVDGILHSEVSSWPYGSCVSFAAFFHYVNSVLDNVILRLEQVFGAFEKLSPDRVIAFQMSPYHFTGITSLDHSPWGLVSHLVPMVAEATGTQIVWVGKCTDDPSIYNPARDVMLHTEPGKGDRSNHVRGIFRRVRRAFKTWCKQVKCGSGQRLTSSSLPDKPLLISSLFSDLGTEVMQAWENRGGESMGINEAFPLANARYVLPTAASICESLWRRLCDEPDVRACMIWKNVDIWPLLSQWLQNIIVQHIPLLYQRADVVWQKLVVDNAYQKAAVIAGGWVMDHYVIARIAEKANLPTISYHYGGFLGFSLLPKHERYDFAECDYFLCGGSGAAEAFNRPSAQTHWNTSVKRAIPVPTGVPWIVSHMNSRLTKSGSQPSRKRVMVILNALLGDCRDNGFQFSPEIQYWRFTRRLVDRLIQETDLDIIVKPPLKTRYPQMPNPLIDWLEERRFPNVNILYEVPLKDCLEQADAYIFESPSTPLLQIAATNKPILLYMNQDDYLLQSRAADALRARSIVFAETEKDFFEQLEEFLCRPVWNIDDVDDTFLRDYAIGSGEGTASERIAAFLEMTIVSRRTQSLTMVNELN